jgi:hypothetical protein
VSRTAQRWHVSFTVEADRDVPARHPRPGTAIGTDLGPARHVPTNPEPGTPHGDQTGTATTTVAAA